MELTAIPQTSYLIYGKEWKGRVDDGRGLYSDGKFVWRYGTKGLKVNMGKTKVTICKVRQGQANFHMESARMVLK